jgi:hypothetical protein
MLNGEQRAIRRLFTKLRRAELCAFPQHRERMDVPQEQGVCRLRLGGGGLGWRHTPLAVCVLPMLALANEISTLAAISRSQGFNRVPVVQVWR